MATGTQPDAGQILNSLINSILLIDDNLAIHYANPAAQQLLAQSSRKLFGTPLPELLSYFSLNIELMQERKMQNGMLVSHLQRQGPALHTHCSFFGIFLSG